jgi:ABC-type uncharacterized transport system involved in gliding motility auxiliary subunit
MRPTPPGIARSNLQLVALQNGSARLVLLVLVAFSFGVAVTAVWLRRPAKSAESVQPATQLSAGTKTILDGLDKPIEMRFYSVLDPSEGAALSEFSHRAEQLLSTFQQEAKGKIAVTLFDSQTNAAANAALEDGIQAFGQEKGEGSYLGVALSCGEKREVLPKLMPQWEFALEADLSRAIARVAEAGKKRMPVSQSAANSEALQAIKEQIPNYADISLEDGARLLRARSLKEFSAATTEMQTQVQQAQQQLQQAQNGPTADQEAAMKHLQDIQNLQSQKLKEIAAKSYSQVEAWKQLKAGGK